MSDPALWDDVIEALSRAKGVDVTVTEDGSIEIAAIGQPIRCYPIRSTVARRLLWDFVRWYQVPIEAFFRSYGGSP